MKLREMHRHGRLGGAVMPEDANPGYARHTQECYLYFTLPMALNYQRDSYKLWAAAKRTAEDHDTAFVFSPSAVASTPEANIREALMRHRVALQPNKHIDTWRRICGSLADYGEGDVRKLLSLGCGDVLAIADIVQVKYKKGFPYLSGTKIFNYWLYVLSTYTDLTLVNRERISIAPDTHVLQASTKLGVVTPEIASANDGRVRVADAWERLLEGSGICPIDIHTPLWLWSRGGFPAITS